MFKRLIMAYNIIDASTRLQLPLAFIVMLLLSSLEVLGISLVFPLIQSMLNSSNLSSYSYFNMLSFGMNIESNYHVALIISCTVFGLFILKNILSILLIKWQVKFLARADLNLSVNLMRQYMSLPYIAHLSINSVDIARNIMNVVSAACSTFLGGILIIATECVMVTGIVLMLFLFSPLSMLLISLFMGVMAWVFQFYFKEQILKSGQNYLEITTKAWKKIVQTFLVIKDLRILGREENVFKEFSKLREELFQVEVVQKFTQFLPRYFLEIGFSIAALSFCIFIFKFQQGDFATHLALLAVVGVSFVRIIPSVNRILATLQLVRANIPAVEALKNKVRIDDIFKQKKELGELSDLPIEQSGLILKGIDFIYPNREEPALRNINLTIRWGESLGLVGKSGSGKSTLVDIILGLLSPCQGKIFLDGKDLAKDLMNWRKKIGYVPQNIYLCDDTILQNITLGVPKNEIDENALRKAIDLSNVGPFIKHLPEGLNTVIGEQGVQLSGGQRQCIGIARALYHDPEVLILDEATSSLDNESERQISNMLEKLYGEKTLIIIAHRLSTVRRCDKIVFLEKGSINGIGTFETLQDEHADFKKLVELGTL